MKRSSFSRTFERPPRRLPSPPSCWREPQAVGMSQPVPKDAPLRSEAYRRWIAAQPCILCGVVGRTNACHTNVGKGMALKASDTMLFPACGPSGLNPGCHWKIDNSQDMTKDERRTLEARLVLKTQAKAMDAGWNLSTLTRGAR